MIMLFMNPIENLMRNPISRLLRNIKFLSCSCLPIDSLLLMRYSFIPSGFSIKREFPL